MPCAELDEVTDLRDKHNEEIGNSERNTNQPPATAGNMEIVVFFVISVSNLFK